jgi:hypothetical protein
MEPSEPVFAQRIKALVRELADAIKVNEVSDAQLLPFLADYFAERATEQQWRAQTRVNAALIEALFDRLFSRHGSSTQVNTEVLVLHAEVVGIPAATIQEIQQWCIAGQTSMDWILFVFLVASFGAESEEDTLQIVATLATKAGLGQARLECIPQYLSSLQL